MSLERLLRKAASDLLYFKDGYKQITKYQHDFNAFAARSLHQQQSDSLERLAQILRHAYYNTVYYRQVFDEAGFHPDRFSSFQDLVSLPLLEKNIIRARKSDFIARNYRSKELDKSYTGGTSGTQTSFYRDRVCTSLRMGRQFGILERCGYLRGERCALIWGLHEDLPDSSHRGNLKDTFRRFASGKESLCCQALESENMKNFHRRLLSSKPSVLYGYPNAIFHFANFLQDRKLRPIRVKAIICTAERLTEEHRRTFQEAFQGEVFNLYCTREHGCIGFECTEHKGFHIDIGSVWVEIVNNGKLTSTSQTGDLVITDLFNYGMPFIRNHIGDRGQLSGEACACGSELPLLKRLEGRITDMVYRPDGKAVSGCLLTDMFMDFSPVKALQIIQKEVNQITVNLVVTGEFTTSTQEKVLDELRSFLGWEMQIDIVLVPDIPRNPISGKFQEVICSLKSGTIVDSFANIGAQ